MKVTAAAVRLLCAQSLLVLVITCSYSVLAQTTVGIQPYGSYQGTIDQINLADLGIHIEIPIFQHRGRGDGMGVYARMVYDSGVTPLPTVTPGEGTWYGLAGWHLSYGTATPGSISVSNSPLGVKGNAGCEWAVTYSFIDTTGYNHIFTPQDAGPCGGPNSSVPKPWTGTLTSLDGTGYVLSANGATATVSTPSGLRYSATGIDSVNTPSLGVTVDANGNTGEPSPVAQYSSFNLTDDAGVAISIATNPANGPSQSLPFSQTVQYTDTTGKNQSVTINFAWYDTSYTCPGGTESYGHSGTVTENNYLVNSIVYPDGSSYQFDYGTSGALASITLPGGGTIQYQGTLGGEQTCTRGVGSGPTGPSNMTRITTDGQVSYARTITGTNSSGNPNTSTTQITTPNGGESISFVLATTQNVTINGDSMPLGQPLWLETAHSWSSQSGSTLKSRMRCYTAVSQSCTTTAITLPITLISNVTTLDNGLASKTVQYINATGMPTELDEYDYGASSPTRKTITAYASLGNNITSQPNSVTVTDGNGNPINKTTYGYDECSLSTSGVSGLTSISGSRGNRTSQHDWNNVSGATEDSHWKYDDAGQVVQSEEPNGISSSTCPTGTATTWTTYGHDGTDAYVTSITPPTSSSGVSLSTSTPHDLITGLLTSTTDPNGTTTKYSYDEMLRLHEIDIYDSSNGMVGKEVFNPTPTQFSDYRYQNSSVYQDTEILYDGYGRQSRVAIANGQSSNPWYLSDTCYNSMGQIGFQSYRYQGSITAANVCSGSGGDSYTSYDALGRPLTISHGDGTSIAHTYTGRAAQVTDENGVRRIIQVDGLGRITTACEISSNSSMPGSGSPTSCGTDFVGTGFTTGYSYDLTNHKTTVTEGAQTRVFQNDSLGRTILTQEPERGQTTYSYSYSTTNGLGLIVTRKRPTANQMNSSVLTTTTTQYDSLGRVVGISYTDGTPTRTFAYDQATAWGNSTLSLGASKGRLTFVWTTTPYQPAFGFFAYDAMGRISRMDQCLPSTGCDEGLYEPSVLYTYDWLGNVLSSSDGEGVTTSYVYTPANEVQSITRSPTDATHLGTLVSNVQNGPFGPLSYVLGNGITAANQYDNMGRNSTGWVCNNGSTSPGCGGGTLYAYGLTWTGTRITGVNDDSFVANHHEDYGYDEFNRLTSRSLDGGAPAYNVYDRYGNRWGEQGGFNQAFNAATNQVSGFSYDAAGNLLSDGVNTYSYDAEGNVIGESGTATQTFIYNALNQQVAATWGGSPSAEVVFDQYGKLASVWRPGDQSVIIGKNYWGDLPLTTYVPGTSGQTYFDHFDWLGTKRLSTTSTGTVYGSYTSLPFGDGWGNTSGNDDNTFDDFAQMWDNGITSHAQFREYSHAQGRWMQPDPYSGSYDFSNPQSLNRYSYVLNNPLSFIDPTGQECVWDDGSFDSADDKVTGSAEGCAGQGGTWVSPALFENAMLSNGQWTSSYGDWSSSANSGLQGWTAASGTAYGSQWAAGQEVDDALNYFYGSGAKPTIIYPQNDPFTLSFESSTGMQGILAGIKANCSATSGSVPVGTWEAFANTMIDGPYLKSADGSIVSGYYTPEAQLGAFNSTYSRSGGVVNITVTNPITLNSAALHMTAPLGIPNPTSGPFGTVNQELHITVADPCQ